MLRKNLIANLLGRAWGIISLYFFLPLYLEFLGVEAYGLVGFYSTLLGLLAFADLGLTATLNRELARLSVNKDAGDEMASVLRTYESIYVCISFVIATTLWLLAPAIAGKWLQLHALSTREVTAAIRLMGITVALQLPSSLFVGGLVGLQRQVLTNCLQVGWSVFRGVGALCVLWLVSPTILAFASWQLSSGLVYCCAARVSLWRTMPSAGSGSRFAWRIIRETWRYAIGMASMTLLGTCLTQGDKLFVSKLLPLDALGYYTVACSLAQAPLLLSAPIGTAVFPRLTGLVAKGDLRAVRSLYHLACSMVSIVAVPSALTLGVYAYSFVLAWTGSRMTAQHTGLVASLLIGGQALQALTAIPCYLALAHGHTRIHVCVQLGSLALLAPLLLFSIRHAGMIGGGLSWLVVNLFILPLYMYAVHRRFMPGECLTWCLEDVGRPLLFAVLPVLVARLLLPTPTGRIATMAFIGAVWSASGVLAGMSIPAIRDTCFRRGGVWLRCLVSRE